MASISLSESSYLTSDTDGFQNIYIVRHGESELNVKREDGYRLTSGKGIKIPLTEKGKVQAAAFGLELLKKIPPEAPVVICSSTALRAQTTADIIFQELSKQFKCERGENYDGLLELGQGDWEEKKKDSEYLKFVNQWKVLSASEKFKSAKVPGGESFETVGQRALSDLQSIVDQHKGKILIVVMHNAAMQSLQLRWEPVNLSKEPQSSLPLTDFKNCEILKATLRQDKVDGLAQLLRMQSKV